MAEGVIFGVLGIPGLVKTGVDFLELITLERNYGKDYEVSIAKASILKSRLHGCGESLATLTASHDPNDPSSFQHKPQAEAIRESLLGLKGCFDDEQKLHKTYGLKRVVVEDNTSMVASTSSNSNSSSNSSKSNNFKAALSPRLADVQKSFSLAIHTRQKETPLPQKIWWVVHDKKKFDSLIYDALFYVESIEATCIQLKVLRTEDEIVRAAVDRVTTREGIELLQQAVDEMPSRLAPAGKEKTKDEDGDEGLAAESTGHLHIRSVVTERAKFIMGDIDVQAGGAQHVSRDGKFSGDAFVIGGNMSAEAFKAFIGK